MFFSDTVTCPFDVFSGWCVDFFVVFIDDRLHVWHATVAYFNIVFVKDFVESVLLREVLFDEVYEETSNVIAFQQKRKLDQKGR